MLVSFMKLLFEIMLTLYNYRRGCKQDIIIVKLIKFGVFDYGTRNTNDNLC